MPFKDLMSEHKNVHTVVSNSSKADIFIYDTLRKKCTSVQDTIFEIKTKKDFEAMVEIVSVESMLAKKWLFVLEYKKIRGTLIKKKGVLENSNSEFLIKFEKYKDMLDFRKNFSEIMPLVNEMYIPYLRWSEVSFLLYDSLEKGKISSAMFQVVARSYARDAEAVFKMKEYLEAGFTVTTRKEVAEVCGGTVHTLNEFVLSLLTAKVNTVQGVKTSMRLKASEMNEFSKMYEPNQLRGILRACLSDILLIKQLYLNGVIYDSFVGTPDELDVARLKRYERQLPRIVGEDLPYERIVRAYKLINEVGVWRDNIDMMKFLYLYYELRKEEMVGDR